MGGGRLVWKTELGGFEDSDLRIQNPCIACSRLNALTC